MNTELIGLFASSEDATKVSTRVTAVLIGASTMVVAVAASFFHVAITPSDYLQFATGLGYIVAAIVFLVGVGKALIQKFGKKAPIV